MILRTIKGVPERPLLFTLDLPNRIVLMNFNLLWHALFRLVQRQPQQTMLKSRINLVFVHFPWNAEASLE